MRKLSLLIAFAAALVALPAVAVGLSDEERVAYKEQVEPICRANTEANEKILDGVRRRVKEGELKAASRQVFRAAQALKRARAQLLQVPKPPSDGARITKWLKGVKTEIELFEAVGRKLAHGEANAANRMVVRLYSNANRTNNLVLDYEFRYCRFRPSKFI